MNKPKFTAWFEVNLTFGSREITILNSGGPSILNRVNKTNLTYLT